MWAYPAEAVKRLGGGKKAVLGEGDVEANEAREDAVGEVSAGEAGSNSWL